MKTLIYENAACFRCSGTGYYGPVCVAGGKCFHCGGQGAKLTKRGAAAQEYARSLSTVRADELKVGDTYREIGVTNGADVYSYWAKVERVYRDGDKLVVESTSRYQQLISQMQPDAPVRLARSAAEVFETRALGLMFQSLLTKSGQVAKSSLDLVLS